MRKPIALLAMLTLAGCGMAGAPKDALVELAVREPGGVARADAPVTTGVPFPQGEVPGGTALALRAGSGDEVPLQTRALAHWPDGSVKWTLLDFRAPALAADGAAKFWLVAAEPKARPTRPVSVSHTKNAIRVDTGPMQAAISIEEMIADMATR
ncbi:MAG: hypothetical protein R6V58_06740, partial [Planctomycetota bacterium]